MVTQDGARICRALDRGLRSLGLISGNGELWRMPEEGSDVVFRCLVVVPWGLCSRLASSPQPRQHISLA